MSSRPGMRRIIRATLREARRLRGEETWQTMLQVSEVHEAREKSVSTNWGREWCSDTVAEGMRQVACKECDSQLVRPVPNFSHPGEVKLSVVRVDLKKR